MVAVRCGGLCCRGLLLALRVNGFKTCVACYGGLQQPSTLLQATGEGLTKFEQPINGTYSYLTDDFNLNLPMQGAMASMKKNSDYIMDSILLAIIYQCMGEKVCHI